ncbi:MAG: hypothetical protein ACHQ49_18260, partial [Elusimicrobiota bacterium]
FKTPAAQKLDAQIAAHEQNVLAHVTGRKTSSFTELARRQEGLARDLSAAGVSAEERAALAAHLEKIGRLLTSVSPLARGAETLDSRLQRFLRAMADASKDPTDALTQVTDQLRRAAADPAAAGEIFDNLKSHAGAPPDSKADLDAVRLEFGQKDPIVYTSPDNPRTLKSIAKIKAAPPAPGARETQAPPVAPAAPVKGGGTVAEALQAAYRPFQAELPNGAEKAFAEERQKRTADLWEKAGAAEKGFGGDPNTMDLDALVGDLLKREEAIASRLGVGGDITERMPKERLEARLVAVNNVNPDLARFMEAIVLYRLFVADAVSVDPAAQKEIQAPLGATFKPWELFSPLPKGMTSATVEGYERDDARYVGLNYSLADGSTRFEAENSSARRKLLIFSDKTKKTFTEVEYDGAGKPQRAVTEEYSDGVLANAEVDDAAKGTHEIRVYRDGKAVQVQTVGADGRRRIQDLIRGLDTRVSAHGDVVIHGTPAPSGTPPAAILQVGKLDAQGNIVFQKIVMQDGRQTVTKSEHVNQLLDANNQVQGWNVAIGDLVVSDDPAARQKLAAERAAEVVTALYGTADAEKAKVLAGFLLDYAKPGPGLKKDAAGHPDVRLFINSRMTFMLMFANADGTRRIVSGVFKSGPQFDGKTQGTTAFGVMGEILAGIDGKVRQDDPTIQYEYLFDGARLHWAPPATETVKAPYYKFWQDDQKVTHFFLQKEVRSGTAGWTASGQPVESLKDKLTADVDGSSLTSSLARGVGNLPVVGQTLNFVGDSLGTIYKGAHYVVDSGVVGVMDLAGSDARAIDQMRVERDANLANNPLSKLIQGGFEPNPDKDPDGWRAYHQKQVDVYAYGMTDGERAILAERARKERAKNLDARGLTADRAPEARASAMDAGASDDEIYGAYSHFGAGSYGARLGEHGHPYYGMLVQGTEVVVESLPAGMILGLVGKGAEGLQLLAETMPKAAMAFRVGELGLRVLDSTLRGTIIAQVALMSADHIGKAFQYRDDPTKFAVNGGNALGDLAFGGMMLRGWMNSRSRAGELKPDLDESLEKGATPALDKSIVHPEMVASDDGMPEAPEIAPAPGPVDEIRIPAGDRASAETAPARETAPTAEKSSTAEKAPAKETGSPKGKPSGDEAKRQAAADVAQSDYARLQRAGSWISERLSSLLGRARAEATKLGPEKSETALDETKAPEKSEAAKGPVEEEGLGAKKAETAEKAPEEKAAERGDKDEKAEVTEKAEKTERSEKTDESEEKVKERRTDRLGRWNDKLEERTPDVGRLVALAARPLPVVPPGPRGGDDADKNLRPVEPENEVKPADEPETEPEGSNPDEKKDADKKSRRTTSTKKSDATSPDSSPASSAAKTSGAGGGSPGGGAAGDDGKHPQLKMPGGGGG